MQYLIKNYFFSRNCECMEMTSSSSNRMAGYNQVYNQHNQAYDVASERNSQMFFDALSIASGSDRNSIALSIYHSVPELAHHHNDDRANTNSNDKVMNIKLGQMKG